MSTVTVLKSCPWGGCGKVTEVEADADALRDWQRGAFIQNAFPDWTARQRETLKTGYCAEHMTTVFGPEKGA